MNEKVKALWLEALRSGQYKQNKLSLRRGDKYCVLGVLCDLYPDGEWLSGFGKDLVMFYSCDGLFGDSYKVPPRVLEWADWSDTNISELNGLSRWISSEDSLLRTLQKLNDVLGYTFNQLADLVEEYL